MENKQKIIYFSAGAISTAIVLYIILNSVLQGTAQGEVVGVISSPDNGYDIIGLIKSANKTIDLEMYTFSSEDALNALLYANDKGVHVRVILEKDVASQENQKTFDKLTAAGIDVRWATQDFTLTHAKMIIIDGKLAIVGSHNLSKNALTKNREISVVIIGPEVSQLEAIFQKDWENP